VKNTGKAGWIFVKLDILIFAEIRQGGKKSLPHLCGNKMPTRCNRLFRYCRSYCLLNMFRAPLCPSSGAQEYYTGGCCLWYLVFGFQVVGLV